MPLAFVMIAVLVGALPGALMAYESRDLRLPPGGWMFWLFLVLVAVCLASATLLVVWVNTNGPVSTAETGLSVLGATLTFAVALLVARRRRARPPATSQP